MSEILHCDPGNHDFSANDPDRKTWTEQQSYNDANAGKRPMRFDACGEHRGYDGMGTDAVKERSLAMQKLLEAPKVIMPSAVRKDGKKLVDAEEYDRYMTFLESNKDD